MSVIKYLLDEHVDPRLQRALRRHSLELIVWCVGDIGAPARSTSDPEILEWCETNVFSLVTNNRASMPLHLGEHLTSAHHIPGIFILNPNMTFGETLDELILIWGASETEEYADRLNCLPVSS